MAEVAFAGHHRHTSSIGSLGQCPIPVGGPQIEMVPNPEFSFPAMPMAASSRAPRAVAARRPQSMHLNLDKPANHEQSHRRAASTLPSFTFNSADSTGLQQPSTTPPESPNETLPTTPSRRGHKRGGSEFVGGDSRFGVAGAISSSPTKSNALPLPVPQSGPPAGSRGHRHRRSEALSHHDLSSIMQPSEPQPRTSSSLPNTPLEHPAQTPPFERAISSLGPMTTETDVFGPALDSSEARPPSRPRVGFSENVEIIPRPLSTISSETESSMSTAQGHSVNNSISSVLSLSTPSPQSSRNPRPLLSTTFEDEDRSRARSSIEISKRVEKEGEWLKSRTPSQSMQRPLSESAASPPSLSFAMPEAAANAQQVHRKRHSLGHALGFDRRRSEPLISLKAAEPSRMSTISLQEAAGQSAPPTNSTGLERRSSTMKIKEWAASRLTRKSRDAKKSHEDVVVASNDRPQSSGSMIVAGKVPFAETPVAETDLDAVFSSQASEPKGLDTPSQLRIEVSTPSSSHHSSFQSRESDDTSPMLDLDAALGPFKTPPLGLQRQRRELHSSRLTKDFTGPGAHYHRRIESAPESTLPTPDFGRMGTPCTASSLPDVFEGDEDRAIDDSRQAQGRGRKLTSDEDGVGVHVVDTDTAITRWSIPSWNGDNGLRIQRGEWELERPSTSYGNARSRLSTPTLERRASSIMEETIPEETSPVEVVEIVEAHEEPRSSSLTKSSDSSETPTLLAAPAAGFLPETAQSLMTPDTYQTSTFSTPDVGRRQGSFDTSRLGTSASSIADNRTMSSSHTGDQSHDVRISVDDVPSLTSSRSTMMSTMHANGSKRDFSDRSSSVASATMNPTVAAERRRKRASIASLSQLVGGSFSGKSKTNDDFRPQTAFSPATLKPPKKKEYRLKKLMFWRNKSKTTLDGVRDS